MSYEKKSILVLSGSFTSNLKLNVDFDLVNHPLGYILTRASAAPLS